MCSNVVVDLRAEMEFLAHSVMLLLLLVRRANSAADSQRLLTEADLVRRTENRAKEGERDERERWGLSLKDWEEEICKIGYEKESKRGGGGGGDRQ
jgi:hypothetical protein